MAAPLASRHQDLQTMIMVEMDVHPGHDMTWKIVLDASQFSRQIRHVVIVHEGNRGHGFLVFVPFLPDETIPNQIAYRLRPVRIFPPLYQTIEIHEQMLIE
jgi:hypothetical protein